MKNKTLLLLAVVFICGACFIKNTKSSEDKMQRQTYINPLLDAGAEPWAILYNGKYYYTQGAENKIVLWETTDITDLRNATRKEVWIPDDRSYSYHLWGPEIHRINNKWYVYFAADDGNMDNHQLYVIENEADNPLEGEWKMKSRISTDKNDNWAIHASVFQHKGEYYMTWCGWPKQRISEENQCLYIARMENPWTLATERVMISSPEYEWERQWISPDGSKTAYPIYVNEAPHYFQSKNRDKVLIYYSASGSWTPYYNVGLLIADADSDLLNPESWEKVPTPVFSQNPENNVYGPGGLTFVESPDGKEWYALYHARRISNDAPGAIDSRTPRLMKIEWDEKGIPVFALPDKEGTPLPLPSGTG